MKTKRPKLDLFNSPSRQRSFQRLKKGTSVGEGAFREVAAYVLDHPKAGRRSFSGDDIGFAGVPPTVMAKCLHMSFNHRESLNVKIGSLQMFMKNHGSFEDMGSSSFPVEEVHKISVFDIRMANADRHAGNILVGKDKDGKTVLIPIDHGYCLSKSAYDLHKQEVPNFIKGLNNGFMVPGGA